MSWGERSCKHIYGECPMGNMHNMWTCSVNCPQYEWDGKTKPDSQREE